VECEIADPKQASMKRFGQALGWLHQKLIPRALVAEAGAWTSYRPLKA
jgi:hypothetical protein